MSEPHFQDSRANMATLQMEGPVVPGSEHPVAYRGSSRRLKVVAVEDQGKKCFVGLTDGEKQLVMAIERQLCTTQGRLNGEIVPVTIAA